MEHLVRLLSGHYERCRQWPYFVSTVLVFAVAPFTYLSVMQDLHPVAGIIVGSMIVVAMTFFAFFVNALAWRWHINVTQSSLIATALVSALLAEILISPFGIAFKLIGLPVWLSAWLSIGAALGLFVVLVIRTVATCERQTHLVTGFLVIGGTMVGAFVLLVLNRAAALMTSWVLSVAN